MSVDPGDFGRLDERKAIMSTQGRLSKERFGPSMPVHAPFLQNLPIYFRNARLALFQYVTDGEQAAELLPTALELTDPPTGVLVLIEYPWTTIGPYNEAIQTLVCTYKSRAVQYVPHILVTSDVAMAGGRSLSWATLCEDPAKVKERRVSGRMSARFIASPTILILSPPVFP
jgi:acetoacetate decarboxylase